MKSDRLLGTFNYELAAVGTLGTGASVNTLRYTGTTGSVSGALTANGLMNVCSDAGLLTFSGTMTIGATNELVLMPITGAISLAGVVQDGGAAGRLLVTSTPDSTSMAVVNLTKANTYFGGTTVSNARLTIRDNNALGSGAVSVLKGAPSASNSSAGDELRLTNDITITNNLTLAGNGLGSSASGALRNQSGNNTAAGLITIADNSTAIRSAAGTLTLNGSINLTTASNYSTLFQVAGGDIHLGGSGITGLATQIGVSGVAAGTNWFFTDVANAWGGTTSLLLGQIGTAYGRVDLNGRDQSVSAVSTLGADSTQNFLTNSSGTLATLTVSDNSVVFNSSVAGNAFIAGAVAGSGNLSLQNNAGSPAAVVPTVGTGNASASYSGALIGAGALTKTGSGTQTLTGTNSYTGGTNLIGKDGLASIGFANRKAFVTAQIHPTFHLIDRIRGVLVFGLLNVRWNCRGTNFPPARSRLLVFAMLSLAPIATEPALTP